MQMSIECMYRDEGHHYQSTDSLPTYRVVVQDEVWQASKEWTEKENNANVDRMHTEMKNITIGTPIPSQPIESPDDDLIWLVLTSSSISMPLHKLLQLLP